MSRRERVRRVAASALLTLVEFVEVLPPVAVATADASGGTVCECGSVSFRWEEAVDHWRDQGFNVGGVLSFNYDNDYDEGSYAPGVVCVECSLPVLLPAAVDVEWDLWEQPNPWAEVAA